MNLLTHTRMQTRKSCPKKHHLRYDLGIIKDRPSQPLRMGSAVHEALDKHAQAKRCGLDDAIGAGCNAIYNAYFDQPDWCEAREWDTEREICLRLFTGYVWRWENDGIEIIATEQEFEIPIINPATGATSKTYNFAGKIDKIARQDGQLVIIEHKTTGDSIEDPDAKYWGRLRVDTQISGYMLAARALGHDVVSVLYDVIHKPGMRPLNSIPCVDGLGQKTVVDEETGRRVYKANGEPYQSASKKGHKFQTRQETITEYGERLSKDIYSRPDFYYQRRPIPRLDHDLDEFRHELWLISKDIRNAERHGYHYKNTQACLDPYPCEFQDACWQGFDFETETPTGFVRSKIIHPELGDSNAAPSTDSATAAETEVAACAD